MIQHLGRALTSVLAVSFLSQVFWVADSSAAIAPKRSEPELGVRAISVNQTLAVLDLPLANRISALRAQGPAGYRNLRAIMFDPKSKIDSRWRSTMAVGRLGGDLSLPELERAMKADVWELRSASLLAVSRFDRKTASKWARTLLQDKALLVRLTAVETLEAIQDRGAVSNLWAQLENAQNFKRNQSLFIRRRIVEALAKLETRGSEARFAALLEDADANIHAPAISALERLTGQTLGQPKDPLARRRALWQQWNTSRG